MVERSCKDQNNGQKVWPKTRPNKALEGGDNPKPQSDLKQSSKAHKIRTFISYSRSLKQ